MPCNRLSGKTRLKSRRKNNKKEFFERERKKKKEGRIWQQFTNRTLYLAKDKGGSTRERDKERINGKEKRIQEIITSPMGEDKKKKERQDEKEREVKLAAGATSFSYLLTFVPSKVNYSRLPIGILPFAGLLITWRGGGMEGVEAGECVDASF